MHAEVKITSQHRNRLGYRKASTPNDLREIPPGRKPAFVSQFASTNGLSPQTDHVSQ